MINKILKFSFFISVLFLVNSCKDSYDIIQDGELSDEVVFKNVDDLQKFLNGSVYGSLDNTSEIQLSAVFTDEVSIGPSNGGQDLDLHRFNLFVDEGTALGIWYGYYNVINKVNRLLEAAGGITPMEGEEDRYNDILGQARALRAFSYVQLEAYFSTDMSDPGALGVMKLDFVPESLYDNLPRVSNEEIFSLIDSDLQFAEQYITSNNGYYYVTPYFVDAVKARYYLYREMYNEAGISAQKVIDDSGLDLTVAGDVSDFYSNPSSSDYKQMFQDQQQGEIIFALSRPENLSGGVASLFYFNSTDINGSPFLTMGNKLVEELANINADVRYYSNIDGSSDDAQNIFCIDKYPGKGGANLLNDLKLFRLSEMYLILAEVNTNSNNFGAASDFVNEIRNARNFNGTPQNVTFANAQEAWKGILNERRLEFCFEGFRYVDLKRLGAKANETIDRSVLDDIEGLPLSIPITDHRFTLPIPLAEVQANPNITQNPGYSN